MRLSDVLSKPITTDYVQIEGFLGSRKLKTGNSKKIAVGKVALNYYCNNCGDQRTFYSGEDLFCIGVNEKAVSIDCVLECPRCGASVQMWFLLECREEDNIHSQYPYVRIVKRSEKFSEAVSINTENYGDFTNALEKAKKAAREGFGAGSIVYLRKVFERIITQTAEAANPPIETRKANGNLKPFIQILTPVKDQCNIIPSEFAEDGFVAQMTVKTDVEKDWKDFVKKQKEQDLDTIIKEEKLKPEEAQKFIENSFRDGGIKTTGTDLDKILPPISRFSDGSNRASKKKTVIDKLKNFFEKYFGLV